MNEFDDRIREALRAESDNVWTGVEEQGLFEQALGVLRGQQKFVSVLAYTFTLAFLGLMIFSGFRFFDAETTQHQIAWATGFVFCNSAVAMLKMWFWMQMDRNVVIREVKRLELQVATLAGIVKNQA